MAGSPSPSPGTAATSFTAGGGQRLRVSVWAASHFVTATNIAKAKNIVDDMSILKTIVNDSNTPMNATMDPTVWGPPATKKQFFDQIIAACHANNMQCLAGVDLAEKTSISSRFNQWVHSNPNDAEIDRYAQSVVDRLNDPFREAGLQLERPFDGISFDVEYITGRTNESLAYGVTLAMFYRSVAAKLKVGTGNETRVLGVAGGGLVDPTHWTFQPPGSGTVTSNQTEVHHVTYVA